MRRIAVVLLLMSLLLSACAITGGSNKESPNAGMWKGHSVSSWGEEEPINTMYPGGFDIELFGGGRGEVVLNGLKKEAIWTLKDGYFTIKWGESKASGMLEGNKIVLKDEKNVGVNVIFYKEGTEIPSISQAPISPPAVDKEPPPETPTEPEVPEPETLSETPTEPEVPEEETPAETPREPEVQEVETPPEETEVPVEEPPEVPAYVDVEVPEGAEAAFVAGSWWEGVIENTDIEGDFPYPEEHQVIAYLAVEKSSGRPFFEIYDPADTENPLLSMYVQIETYETFKADIGEGDAWIYDHTITPEEAEAFDGYLYEDMIYIEYNYKEGGGSALLTILLSPMHLE